MENTQFNKDKVSKETIIYTKLSIEDAARLLLDDYSNDKELTAFSVLDSEDFL